MDGRSGAAQRPTVLSAGTLRLDPATRQAWRWDVEIALSTKEFALLEILMRRPGEVLLAILALLLAIGGPVALLLASLAGYGVATAALRPVDAMRRTADSITERSLGERLPVGGADDELAHLGSTLNGMFARLQDAVRRERAFVADAGHELRTPLAILKAEIELALRGERSAAELRGALRSAAEETERLAELADALMLTARADDGGLALATSHVNAATLLEGARDRFGSRAAADGRRLVVDDGPPACLNADRRRIEQALDNLVENALRHGSGAIHLATAQHDGAVLLSVSDEGRLGSAEDMRTCSVCSSLGQV